MSEGSEIILPFLYGRLLCVHMYLEVMMYLNVSQNTKQGMQIQHLLNQRFFSFLSRYKHSNIQNFHEVQERPNKQFD